jgi:hypothetical protein
MIELFFRFTVKGTRNNVSFSACCGVPLYSPAVYGKIRQITLTGFTPRAHLLEKS